MGPLKDIKIIEIGGIGPGPFCGMLLADMGADVLRINRPGGANIGFGVPARFELMHRSRPSIGVDLKSETGVSLVLKLCRKADALFEGNRPGVMEKLGIGPDECMAANPGLVYGRMTGWGQDGPLARTAGHDGNYAAITGAIGAIGGKNGPPAVPLNLVGDFGGGGAYLAIGILAALIETQRSGKGQVVDAAMVDGAASLMTMFYGLHAAGIWEDERESNFLDGAAPFYRPYRTSDDKYIMICAIEKKFFALLLEIAEISIIDTADQFDRAKWSDHIAVFEKAFKTRTRDEWMAVFADTDACVAPVLSIAEAPHHPHVKARQTFVEIDGVVQPAPAPRFSRTRSGIRSQAAVSKGDARRIFADWGLSDGEIDLE